MIAIPTVSLRAGRCALPGGASSIAAPASAVSLDDPVGLVRAFANDGFERVHVEAFESHGLTENDRVLAELLRDGAAELDVTAALENTDQIQSLFDAGAARVVVGSRAIEDPDWLAHLTDLFPGLILLASRVRDREVVTRGWVRRMPTDLLDLAAELHSLPLAGLVVSAAELDGDQRALELALLEDLTETASVPVFAAGHFATTADLRALDHRGLAGAVLGAPLYTGELDPRATAQEFAG